MEKIGQIMNQNCLDVRYYCNLCKKVHTIQIPQKSLTSKYYPIKYLCNHDGDPSQFCILYIDKHGDVRGVDYINAADVDSTSIQRYMKKNQLNSLQHLKMKEILAFRLEYFGNILLEFYQTGIEEIISLPPIKNIKNATSSFSKDKEEFDEMFILYSRYRLGMVSMMGADFLVALGRDIDFQRFSTQLLILLEELLEGFFDDAL